MMGGGGELLHTKIRFGLSDAQPRVVSTKTIKSLIIDLHGRNTDVFKIFADSLPIP